MNWLTTNEALSIIMDNPTSINNRFQHVDLPQHVLDANYEYILKYRVAIAPYGDSVELLNIIVEYGQYSICLRETSKRGTITNVIIPGAKL